MGWMIDFRSVSKSSRAELRQASAWLLFLEPQFFTPFSFWSYSSYTDDLHTLDNILDSFVWNIFTLLLSTKNYYFHAHVKSNCSLYIFSSSIVSFIKMRFFKIYVFIYISCQLLTTSHSEDEEQEAWINALLGRIFWDFLGEKYWSDLVSKKIQMKLSKIKVGIFS